jgi:hypothetical protein
MIYGNEFSNVWATLYLQCVQVFQILECIGWNFTYLVEPQVPEINTNMSSYAADWEISSVCSDKLPVIMGTTFQQGES